SRSRLRPRLRAERGEAGAGGGRALGRDGPPRPQPLCSRPARAVSLGRPPAPYRIETGGLVIRCYDPSDAPLLKDAIDSSLEHLRPWMPWAADEPQTLEEKTDLLKLFRSEFDTGENFIYGIFSADETEQVGATGLHPRRGRACLGRAYLVA